MKFLTLIASLFCLIPSMALAGIQPIQNVGGSGGPGSSTFTYVTANGDQFSGDGTADNSLMLKPASVTLQGNSFNAANQLVKTGAGGLVPATVIVSSIALDNVTNGQMAAGTFSKITLPAANVAAGTLGTSVVASSVAFDSVNSAQITDDAIVNADINSSAAIADTKLAQITTAGKVSGAAITSLTSVPSGAGNLPAANLGNAVRKAGDSMTGNLTMVNSSITLTGTGGKITAGGQVIINDSGENLSPLKVNGSNCVYTSTFGFNVECGGTDLLSISTAIYTNGSKVATHLAIVSSNTVGGSGTNSHYLFAQQRDASVPFLIIGHLNSPGVAAGPQFIMEIGSGTLTVPKRFDSLASGSRLGTSKAIYKTGGPEHIINEISWFSDGAWQVDPASPLSYPTQMRFFTTTHGAVAQSEKMVLNSSGTLAINLTPLSSVTSGFVVAGRAGFGTGSPAAQLDVSGESAFGTLPTKSTITAAGFFNLGGALGYQIRTKAQLNAITPGKEGEAYYCSDCTKKILVSTGTSAAQFADAVGGAFQ